MNPIHRTIRLIAAGTTAVALAGSPSIALAQPPLAGGAGSGGPLPIARTETVYTNHTPVLAKSLGLRAGVDIKADLDAAGHAVRWRVLTDGATKFAFMQAAEIAYDKKPVVRFEDLTGDGTPELLVYRKTARPAEGTGLSVYNGGDGFKLLFDVTDPAFTIADLAERYELRDTAGGDGIRFTDPASGLSGVIPAAKASGAVVEPVTSYEVGAAAAKGASGSIVAVQRVSGVSDADGNRIAIGWLRTSYAYRYGAFVPERQTLTDAQGKAIAAVDLLRSEGPGTDNDDI